MASIECRGTARTCSSRSKRNSRRILQAIRLRPRRVRDSDLAATHKFASLGNSLAGRSLSNRPSRTPLLACPSLTRRTCAAGQTPELVAMEFASSKQSAPRSRMGFGGRRAARGEMAVAASEAPFRPGKAHRRPNTFRFQRRCNAVLGGLRTRTRRRSLCRGCWG